MASRLLLFGAAFTYCSGMWAQAPAPIFHTLGVSEGLSHNSVYSVMQSSDGLIWAAGADGINRYDGNQVKTFKAGARAGKEASYHRENLFEDSRHNIWSVNNSGIWCVEAHSGALIRKLAFANRPVMAMSMNSSGELWILDILRGVSRYNTLTGDTAFIPFPFTVEADRIQYARTASAGRYCWIRLYADDGYWQFDKQDLEFAHFLPAQNIRSLSYASDKLWVSLGNSLLQMSSDGQVRQTIDLPDESATEKVSVVKDAWGRIWVATYGHGLLLFDSAVHLLQHYRANHHRSGSLPSDFCTALTIDRSRNLWIGTDGGGLARIDLKPPAFGKFPLDDRDHPELSDFFIKSLYEDARGRVWFGNLNGGLSRYDTRTQTLECFAGRDAPRRISNIYPLPDGSLLLSHLSGLARFKDGRFFAVNIAFPAGFEPARSAFSISGFAQCADGSFLASTSVGLLFLSNPGREWRGSLLPISAVHGRKLSDIVAAERVNQYWIATPYEGLLLVRVDAQGATQLQRYFPQESVLRLHRDEINSQVLWIGTAKGLLRVNTTTGKGAGFSVENGLKNDHIYSILEDETHAIWISTNAGLSRISRAGKIDNFSQSCGLQSNEFNSGVCSKSASTSRLCFGGVAGFNWLSAASVGYDTARASAVITDVFVDEKGVSSGDWEDGHIALSHNDHSVSFQIAATDFTRPDANLIRYQLKGWDMVPIEGAPGLIRYTNLSPGDYSFHVRASGSNHLPGPETVCRIRVTAPFWHRGWFYALCGIAAVSILVLSMGYFSLGRLRKVEAQLAQRQMLEDERSRISQDLHDEIGSALTQISQLSNLIPMQENVPRQLLDDVALISMAAQRVTQSVSEIIWTLHPQDDSLVATLAYIREHCVDFLGSLGMEHTLDFPESVPEMKLSGEQRRNLFLVTKEVMNNVVKHAGATHLAIRCVLTETTLAFEIVDNGRGFGENPGNSQANGMHNLRWRMDSIGGTIQWLQPGTGTTVIYSLPMV